MLISIRNAHLRIHLKTAYAAPTQSRRAQSLSSPPSQPQSRHRSPLAVSPAYAVVGGRAYVSNPGGYLVIPPKGKKLSVVYT
ncbi:hypothetical protein LENED_000824 [Lentinula edodes]|uniref:Uncharacterized protein n=1 Tax=Lentinula edodes TaxID=5353 RepID=A0A1Q3DWJ3_LENED|nr:hypothetical protein LENED_000824 [Lentinula edodes]